MADNDFGPFLENVYDEVDAKKELSIYNQLKNQRLNDCYV